MQPTLVITEQPAPRSSRFRYGKEAQSCTPLSGKTSTPTNKTYPTVKLKNWLGSYVVVVSLVTKDAPYRQHPNVLKGKGSCSSGGDEQGICSFKCGAGEELIDNPSLGYKCNDLRICMTKKVDIKTELEKRNSKKVDPYRAGFDHMEPKGMYKIDQFAVRLCFQAFIKQGRSMTPITPVNSDVIYDAKNSKDLMIDKYLPQSCVRTGGKEMILLTSLMDKDAQYQVRFFDPDGDWQKLIDVRKHSVHYRTAVTINIPAYDCETMSDDNIVWVEIRRVNSDECSPAVRFKYLIDATVNSRRKKKPKLTSKTDDPTVPVHGLDSGSSSFQSASLNSSSLPSHELQHKRAQVRDDITSILDGAPTPTGVNEAGKADSPAQKAQTFDVLVTSQEANGVTDQLDFFNLPQETPPLSASEHRFIDYVMRVS